VRRGFRSIKDSPLHVGPALKLGAPGRIRVHAMPITPYLNGVRFDPQARRVLGVALGESP